MTSTKGKKDFKVSVHETIQDIPKSEWDALAPDHALAGHGWLRTVEQTATIRMRPRYFVARDSKTPFGAAVCYRCDDSGFIQSLDNIVFGRLRTSANSVGISCLPALVCCPLYCFGAHILTPPDLSEAEKEGVAAVLLERIEEEARTEGLAVAFINVDRAEAPLIRELTRRRYDKALDVPQTFIDIQWTDFQGYLSYLKSVSRNIAKAVRHQRSKNRKAGVVIETIEETGSQADRLHALVSSNCMAHNQLPFPFSEEFFGALKENMGNDAVFYGASKGGVLIGTVLLLKKGLRGHALFSGVDHRASDNDFTYFNLVYNRPIQDAIAGGMKRIHFGRGMYELKARRGCRLRNLYLYYRAESSAKRLWVVPWFRVLSSWNRHRLPERARLTLEG